MLFQCESLAVAWTSHRKTVHELETRRRGDRLTVFYIEAAAQGYRIDTQFQMMEEALEGLRTAAEWALTGPDPAPSGPPFTPGVLCRNRGYSTPVVAEVRKCVGDRDLSC